MTIRITPIPAYKDNYMWLFHNGQVAAVVDPGESEPIEKYLAEHNLTLKYILITHHHWDHVNGSEALQKSWNCQVFAPDDSRIPASNTTVKEHDIIDLPELGLSFKVFEIPGHTLSHISYHNDDWLFSGDTLFSIGCGRMFEGQPAQFVESLEKFKKLSPATQIYCGHEYTANNIDFALSLEPENLALKKLKNKVDQLRRENKPTLPSTLQQELDLNPFLRTDDPTIQTAVADKTGKNIADAVNCFTELRLAKDEF